MSATSNCNLGFEAVFSFGHKMLSREYQSEFLLAANALLNNAYVLCGSNKLKEVIQLQHERLQLSHLGHFQVHKQVSNEQLSLGNIKIAD